MPDCYDTRSFPQSLIDAIVELWDAATSDGQRLLSAESQKTRGDRRSSGNGHSSCVGANYPPGLARGAFIPWLAHGLWEC